STTECPGKKSRKFCCTPRSIAGCQRPSKASGSQPKFSRKRTRRSVDPVAGALDADDFGNRADADAGLGFELLPSSNPRRSYSGGARGFEIVVFRILLRVAAAAGGAGAGDRQGDRSARWARRARAVEPRARGGAGVACAGARSWGTGRSLGAARDRHGARALRLGLRDPDGAL